MLITTTRAGGSAAGSRAAVKARTTQRTERCRNLEGKRMMSGKGFSEPGPLGLGGKIIAQGITVQGRHRPAAHKHQARFFQLCKGGFVGNAVIHVSVIIPRETFRPAAGERAAWAARG